MHPFRRLLLLKGLELFRFCRYSASPSCSAWWPIRSESTSIIAAALALRLKVSNFALIVVLLTICHNILRANGLYESRRLSTRGAEVRDILKGVTLCVLVFAGAAVAFKIEVVDSRSFIVAFWVTSAGLLIGSRVVLRSALAHLRRRGRNLRQVLIVGTNWRAAQVAVKIGRQPELGYTLLGFADDPWQGLRGFKELGFPVKTDLQHLSDFLRTNVVDEVFICLPIKLVLRTHRGNHQVV